VTCLSILLPNDTKTFLLWTCPSCFYRASIYASTVLGVVILSSVRPSQAWIVAKLNDALQILWHYTRGQSLCYSETNSKWWGWATPLSVWNLRSNWPTPFEKRQLRQISSYNVSTVRDSEKSPIVTNRKSATGFPTSYKLIWSAYVVRYP